VGNQNQTIVFFQGELPPHLFVLAEATYIALMSSKDSKHAKDQSIIISGESGAGKTEATKVIMTFLTRITAIDAANNVVSFPSPATPGKSQVNVGELEQRVLNTNPMLEAFGNARTLRNDNSSRFGKVCVYFDWCC
jgi:myosin heavy subunit